MIKRIIELSADPAHVSARDGQLLITRGRNAASNNTFAGSIPLEDLGLLMIDQRDTTVSLTALAAAAEHGAAVCVCGANHLPVGLLLPLADRHETVWRIQDQIATRLPTKKRLWRQIIRAKIHGQARNLPGSSPASEKLRALRRTVRSGDPDNVEARAARLYWEHWLGEETSFSRVSSPGGGGEPPNNLLNYGYAVMRAAVARAIVSAGLIPAIGIHHRSRSNSFCLADDLVEPLRPLVDRQVQEMFVAGVREISPAAKRTLLALLVAKVKVRSSEHPGRMLSGPLMVALHRYVASFVECIPSMKPNQKLAIPTQADE